ncbi:MAG: hypothetical protein ACFFCS_18715, partial [Candidatus Hodarchaeota archaeon]
FRIVSDFIQNLLLINLVILVFLPNNKEMKVALIIGVFTMFFDLFLEAIAVQLDWWYPKGEHLILEVPIEMVVSFMIIGTSMGIIFYFPEKMRDMNFKPLNWVKILVKNPKYDYIWRIALLFVNAIIGMNGDYSAGEAIWEAGENWLPIYTFFVWFGGGLITLVLYRYLNAKLNPRSLNGN